MNPTPFRQRLLNFLTPKVQDFFVVETLGDINRTPVPAFGTPHKDAARYPNHRLALATQADDQGCSYTLVYVAPRADQDDYNWEYTAADIGGTRFKAVKRTYVNLRAEFTALTPTMGTVMPSGPDSTFTDTYVLAERRQLRSGDQEIDSIFVVEEQIFVKKVPLSNVTLSPEQGRSKRATTTLYYRGEVVPNSGGATVETLASNPQNAYWGQQAGATGVFRELTSQSEDWFAITESTSIAGDGSANGSSNPAAVRTKDYPTPSVLDYLVREVGSDPSNLAYGTAHYDSATYPNHKLSFKRPVAGSGGLLYEFFYSAPRANQDAYNARHVGNDILSRVYVFPRSSYPADLGSITFGADDPQYGDRYGYTHEELVDVDQELHGVFVMVRRFYQQLVKTRLFFDDELERNVSQTTELIEAGTGDPSEEPGFTVEINPVNTFYDEKVTLQLLPLESDSTLDGDILFPLILPSLMEDRPYPFPPLLTDITIETAWALAFNSEDTSFSQDFYFKFHMVEPNRGPYEARVLRYLTPDPDSLRDLYPIHKITPTSESIGVSAWYSIAPASGRCKTFARADELHTPASIHPAITITEPDGPSIGEYTRTISSSPGYANFSALGVITASYETTKTRYGLYLVNIIQINCSGVYSGSASPFGEGNTGAGNAVNTTPTPVISSAVMAADNRTVSGNATPNAIMTISRTTGGVKTELGRGTAGTDGNFTIPISIAYTDTVTLQLFARLAGKLSLAFNIDTIDLTPEAPTAAIDPGLAIVSGLSEPEARIRIYQTPAFQKEVLSVTVPTTISVAGDLVAVFTSALVPTSPVTLNIPVLVGDDSFAVAGKVRDALEFTPALNEIFAFTTSFVSSPVTALEITKRVAAADDITLELTLSNGTSTGLTSTTSFEVVTGRASETEVIADENGEFSYTFAPPLVGGDVLILTATDDGGESAETTLTASSTPPAAPTISPPGEFVAGTYDNIEGVTSPAAVVRAYLNGVSKGSDVADGSGDFLIVVDRNYIDGEVFEVIAADAGDDTIRSAPAIVTAEDLNLVRPELALSNGIYYGQLQAAMLSIATYDDIKVIVRNEGTMVEAAPVEIFANNEFSFNLLTLFSLPAPPQAGERFEVFYRFYTDGTNPATALFDGPPYLIAFPSVPLPAVQFQLVIPLIAGWTEGTYKGIETYNGSNWIDSNGLGTTYPGVKIYRQVTPTSRRFSINPPVSGYFMRIISPDAGVGTSVEISFPGQATAPITTSDLTYDLAPIPRFPYVEFDYPWPLSQNLLIPDTGQAQYTQSELEALIPTLMRVVVTAPDGRQSTTFFDRSTVEPFA